MPFIVGCGRSGTTLLRLMLDAHPALSIPPETGFFDRVPALREVQGNVREAFFEAVTHYPANAPAWRDFGIDAAAFRAALERIVPFNIASGFRTFYRLYAQRHGKLRYGDKTPLHALHLSLIADVLPEAHFIHLIRDGRDVAMSMRRTWFSPGAEVATQAEFWQQRVLAAHAQGQRCAHYLEVHYEDLVTDPGACLKRICDYIALDFDPCMLHYHRDAARRLAENRARYDIHGTLLLSPQQRLANQRKTLEHPDPERIGAWRREMPGAEVIAFVITAGATLKKFGYSIN